VEVPYSAFRWLRAVLDGQVTMMGSSLRIGRPRGFILAAAVVLWTGGLGSIFAQSDTEREAEKTLRDLQIDVMAPEPNAVRPEAYRTPPKIVEQIVGGAAEWKLFYFCRYHTAEELKTILREQFTTKVFTAKPKPTETTVANYTVTSNPATNQLIVRCPTREDIDAILETLDLVDVQPIQVRISCLISDIYADMTFDRETTIEIENLFGEGVALKPGGNAFGADVQQLIMDGTYLPAFPGASLRELQRSRMGLNIGYLSTNHNFTALVDLLESRGYLKILMNPTLEVVNGKTAKVSATEHVPVDTITMRSTVSDYLESRTEYEDVVDSLEITPHVFADGYIGLETDIVLGARNTPDGVKQVPIITKKEITNKENRIREGESLIIGGMRKTADFGVIRGVPILKDLPLIGFLFSGEDTEKRAIETVFILTPTISTNGRPKQEVMADVQRKHDPTARTDLGDLMSDPFGFKARQRDQEAKLQEAEHARLEARAVEAQAHIDVQQANVRAEKAEEELEKVKNDAAQASADAEAKAKEAEAAMAKAKELQAAAEKAKAEADAKAKAAQKAQEDSSKKPGTKVEEPPAEKKVSEADKPKDSEKDKT
jgi:Flp pilus assembly secretin CpaC